MVYLNVDFAWWLEVLCPSWVFHISQNRDFFKNRNWDITIHSSSKHRNFFITPSFIAANFPLFANSDFPLLTWMFIPTVNDHHYLILDQNMFQGSLSSHHVWLIYCKQICSLLLKKQFYLLPSPFTSHSELALPFNMHCLKKIICLKIKLSLFCSNQFSLQSIYMYSPFIKNCFWLVRLPGE